MTWRTKLKAVSGTDSIVSLVLFAALWGIAFFSASALEYGPGVSAWFLPAGLKIAFLLRYGPRFVIPIAVVGLLFGILLWLPHWPVAWLLTDLVPTITYFVGAVFLATFYLPDRPLQTVQQAVAFIIVALSVAAMSGLATVGIMVGQGITPERQYLEMTSAFLLGDLVGMLTIGPVVVLALTEFDRMPPRQQKFRRSKLGIKDLIALLAFGLMAGIVAGLGLLAPDLSHLPYLFFIPIIFAALSAGPLTTTAIIALVNVAVVLFLKFGASGISPLHSQAIMIAAASCGLILMAYRQENLRLTSMTEASQAALHDLKSPLSTLRLFAERISAKTDIDLRVPLSSLENLTRAIFENTALGHSAQRVSSGQVVLEEVFLGLSIQLSPLAERRGLAISFRPTDVVVITDETRLSRVLQNLIVNAIEHSRYGGVLVGCRPYGEGVRLCVYDTGPGLPLPRLRHIFEPNQSASRRADRGFGLTFSKLIVDQLGMRVGVRSVVDRGSCFWIEIPSRLIAPHQVVPISVRQRS